MHLKPKQHTFHTSAGESGPNRLGEAHVIYLDFAADVERRRQGGELLTPVYRIYLRDRDGTAVSGHTISVVDDETAIEVASVLCHACRDVCVKFEIWKGEALMVVSGATMAPPTREELSQRAQQIVVEREIAIRDSHAALADSRRLLDAIDEWQPRRRRRVQ